MAKLADDQQIRTSTRRAILQSKRIGTGIRTLTRAAKTAERARKQKERQLKIERRAREKIFNEKISVAIRGIQNIIALCQNEEMQKMFDAQAQIGEKFELYRAYRRGGSAWEAHAANEPCYVWGVRSPRDQEVHAVVTISATCISFFIGIEFYSSHENKTSEYCTWEETIPFAEFKEKKATEWLRKIAIFSFGSSWEQWEIDDLHVSVDDNTLRRINNASAIVALNKAQKRDEWDPGLVLLKFLMDCSKPYKMRDYLERAVNRLQEEDSATTA